MQYVWHGEVAGGVVGDGALAHERFFADVGVVERAAQLAAEFVVVVEFLELLLRADVELDELFGAIDVCVFVVCACRFMGRRWWSCGGDEGLGVAGDGAQVDAFRVLGFGGFGRFFEADGTASFLVGLDGVEVDGHSLHAQRARLDVRDAFGVLEREAEGEAVLHGGFALEFGDLDGDALAFFFLHRIQSGSFVHLCFFDRFPAELDVTVYTPLFVAGHASLGFAGLLLYSQCFAGGGFSTFLAKDAAFELRVGEVPEGNQVFFAFGDGKAFRNYGFWRGFSWFEGIELLLLGF